MAKRRRVRPPIERVMARTDQSGGPDACWLYGGYLNERGYGLFHNGIKTQIVHRFVYEHVVGPIPEGKVLDHLCHNRDPNCPGGRCYHRSCVNPTHLEPVTHPVNVERGLRGHITHCKAGHSFDPENTYLTGDGRRQCRECRRRRKREQRARLRDGA